MGSLCHIMLVCCQCHMLFNYDIILTDPIALHIILPYNGRAFIPFTE